MNRSSSVHPSSFGTVLYFEDGVYYTAEDWRDKKLREDMARLEAKMDRILAWIDRQ